MIAGIEPHEQRALRNALAFLERDAADAAGHFGPQRHRFVGAQAAHCGDRLRQRRRRHLDCFDGDFAAAAPAGPLLAMRRRARRRTRTLRAEPVTGATAAITNTARNGGC